MASSLCRSTSLLNFYVQRVAIVDIKEIKTTPNGHHSEWAYAILVTWSDTSNHKIYRTYSNITSLYNLAYKLRYYDRPNTVKKWPHLPKVPGRGFFEWSTIKLLVRNQEKVDLFLQVLISLPVQVSRDKAVLDFFERCETDGYNFTSLEIHSTANSPNIFGKSKNCNDSWSDSETSPTELSPVESLDGNGNGCRTKKPPNYLPVRSCFEPDDVTNGYQTLLHDVTSFDLFEDYDCSYTPKSCYQTPRNKEVAMRTSISDEHWSRECQEIISPYSPNKAYFYLVHICEVPIE
ncbi:uncharacterized protein LOC143464470 [Clavelina lepadiformis]|uniref:PX domain-containing protein n=1 Tax=Clavelina lepadiformis TaxID=159417 RepID=A0ABP0F2M1_CLALP